jgi:hypothetical protein
MTNRFIQKYTCGNRLILFFIPTIIFFLQYSCAVNTVSKENKINNTYSGKTDMINEIIKYAAMAPSGHNAQPWKFFVSQDSIVIFPDYSRTLPVVDPDDREMFISLGCALENLIIAAEHFGYRAEVNYNLEIQYQERITVFLKSDSAAANSLFEQIERRQTTRNEYNGNKVPNNELEYIKNNIFCREVGVHFLIEKESINKIIELVKKGNIHQFGDERFMDELKFWIRFSESEAEEKQDGLLSSTTGNPSVPRWIGKIFMNLFHSAKDQNEIDEKFIKSSAGVILFSTAKNDKMAWIETGRTFEKFSLLTTKMNLKCAFINQPVEIKELNEDLLRIFEIEKGYPQLLVRFGYSSLMPKSPRRNLNDVLINKRNEIEN